MKKWEQKNKVTLAFSIIGSILLLISALSISNFLAFFGLAFIFWSVVIFYTRPGKQVSISLLSATMDSSSDNLDRLMKEFKTEEKAIFLPPQNLKDMNDSLLFIPFTKKYALPLHDEPNDQLINTNKTGILIIPPGLSLSRYIEKKHGASFTALDIIHAQSAIERVLCDDLELAEEINFDRQDDLLIIDLKSSSLMVCESINNKRNSHEQVGHLLSSSIGCLLTKSLGRPIVIQGETINETKRVIRIEYKILEAT